MLFNCGAGEDSPWIVRISNQSVLKEINPECSLEVLMLKLKLRYFGHLKWEALIHWKRPWSGKDWRQEKKGMTEGDMIGWHHWLDGHESEQIPGDSKGQGSLACCSPWGRRVTHDLATEQQQQDMSGITTWDVWEGSLPRGNCFFSLSSSAPSNDPRPEWSPETPSVSCETWQSRRGKRVKSFSTKGSYPTSRLHLHKNISLVCLNHCSQLSLTTKPNS